MGTPRYGRSGGSAPSATIVGPSYSGYNHTWLDGFLGRPRPTVPPDRTQLALRQRPRSDSADARHLVSAHGLAPIPQSINEYLFGNQQNAAYTAWFLDRLAVSGVSTPTRDLVGLLRRRHPGLRPGPAPAQPGGRPGMVVYVLRQPHRTM